MLDESPPDGPEWPADTKNLLADARDPSQTAAHEPTTGMMDAAELLYEAGSRAALAMFVDAHNANYYMNSYTTKMNPTMDTVLEKLLAGVRRLNDEWREADAQPPPKADGTAGRRRSDFRRTVQILSRFETSFRRASWKSGSEMVFPILFGHMSFTTHRCWTVFVRKAMFLAGEAWREAYGQLETRELEDDHSTVMYHFPDGTSME